MTTSCQASGSSGVFNSASFSDFVVFAMPDILVIQRGDYLE